MKVWFYLFLGLALVACESSNSNQTSPMPSNSSQAPGNGSSDGGAGGDEESKGLVESKANIVSLAYDAEKHAITAKLSYGGCAKANHQLLLGDVCAESYPMQCNAMLKHSKEFNSTCKMAIEEEVILNLPKSFDTAYVRVESNGKSSSVLVDREGKTKNLFP